MLLLADVNEYSFTNADLILNVPYINAKRAMTNEIVYPCYRSLAQNTSTWSRNGDVLKHRILSSIVAYINANRDAVCQRIPELPNKDELCMP